jgi:hypothetical protein
MAGLQAFGVVEEFMQSFRKMDAKIVREEGHEDR